MLEAIPKWQQTNITKKGYSATPIPEVAGVTFSDSDFAPVPNFWTWIRLLFRLRLPSILPKFPNTFT